MINLRRIITRFFLASCVFYPHTLHATEIPLDIINEVEDGFSFTRLGINAGVNNGDPKEYLFDTGSDSFNIAVGMNNSGTIPSWFPQTGTAVSSPYGYMYGDGTYGYLQSDTSVSNIQFYNSTTGSKIANYDTSAGLGVALIQASIATENRLNPNDIGQQISPDTAGLDPSQAYYQDLSWQQSLDAGKAPDENHFYGIMGAGDFIYRGDNGGVPGQLTKSGYIVEANGTTTTPGDCGASCLIVGLTPALRAQFFTQVPWRGIIGSFPLSGANAGRQFDAMFQYALDNGQNTKGMPTLLDSGTPMIIVGSNDLLGQAIDAGATGSDGYINDVDPGHILNITGNVPNGQTVSVVTGDGSQGDQTNVLTLGSNIYTPKNYTLEGVSFFLQNAVMYDLENAVTGYTPFYVSDYNFTNGLDVSSDMGALGLAGVISGSKDVNIHEGGIAYLTNNNSYTGATNIAEKGWLGIGGTGSISQSAVVNVAGSFDIAHSETGQNIRSLSGSGQVVLGDNTLLLSQAQDTFSGSIRDDYAEGSTRAAMVPVPILTGGENQTHGGVIIGGGQEIFSGNNSYSGKTGVAAAAQLILTGRLDKSQVENAGRFENNGETAALVNSTGIISGNGLFAGGLTVKQGIVTPGAVLSNGGGNMHVSHNLVLDSAATYLTQIGSNSASMIAVEGKAEINNATLVSLATSEAGRPKLGQNYTILTASDGISGQFGAVKSDLTGNALYPFLTTGVDYQSNIVSLEIERSNIAFTNAAQSRNERNVATVLDAMSPTSSLALPVTLLDFAAARNAFNSLSGEIHASARTALIQNATEIRDMAINRMRAADCIPGASTEKTANRDGRSTGATCDSDQGQTLWMQSYGNWSHNSHSANAAGMSNSVGGFVLGGETSLIPNWHIGALVGYGHSGFSVSERASSGHSNNVTLGGYANTHWDRLGLRMGATYTWDRLATRRKVLYADFTDQQSSRYNGGTVQAFADIGYRFDIGRVMVEPFGNAAYINQHTNAFRESGGAAALSGHALSSNMAYATFGSRLASRVTLGKSTVLTPNATIGYRHAFGTITSSIKENFLNQTADFNVSGVPLAENSAMVSVGLQAQVKNRLQLGLSYSGQYSAHYSSSGLKGNISWVF
ncbi:autotransporter outer membrane beta-barrel domain-containing protein [Zymomonas mobilis]|uniref:autotransporter outer membrane beta-barrel domain-containing protein n=1 Tax=Zymomonas mobilis TaxID=542 RepID=UPI0021C3A690|nr:autotransporter domain-containing protein [Zymomonas mobilis]MCP9308625.1 autotransporter domain-containing protein [Zymomonas mobilis]